jgi:sugar phosphate isomerase/epimerase
MPLIDHLGATTLCYPNRNFDGLKRALRGISDAGFRNVGITSIAGFGEHLMPEKQTETEIESVMEWLGEYGLTCSCIVGPHCLNSDGGVATFKRRIDLALTLGTDLVNGGTFWPFVGKAPYGRTEWREATERFYYRLGQAAEYAADRGVRIAIETHAGLVHTGEQCVPLLARVDTDVVGIVYHTGSVFQHDPHGRPEEDIRHVIGGLFGVHVEDVDAENARSGPRLGEGKVAFPALFQVLTEAGFTGPVCVMGVAPPTVHEADAALKNSYNYLCSILQSTDLKGQAI